MRRFDPRLWIGILFVVGGVLSLLEVQGIISNAGGIFWGLIFAAGSALFFYVLRQNSFNWWAAFPAFTLLGMAVTSIFSKFLGDFQGLIFFGGISAAFWFVYFTDRDRWWAIIPAGILLTLGVVSVLDHVSGRETGGSFFLGLGLTFLLVAILPGGRERSWALIPGIILLLFGALLGTPFVGLANYLWPTVLIVLGMYLVFRFLRNQSSP